MWPGGKGGINLVGRVVPDKSLWRRAKGAIPSLEEYYAGGGTRGSATAKAIVRQGGILGTPPEPTLKGAAKLAQAKKVAKTAQTGAQPTAGGKPITSQEQLMADIEAEMGPNNVLGKGTPETTGPARTAAPVAPKRVTTKENIVEFGKTGKKTRQLQRETTTTPLGKEMAKAEGKTVGKTTKKAATRKPPERKAAAKTVAKPTPPAKVKKTTPSPLSSGVKAGISSNQIIETIDRLRAAGMPATIDEIATQLKTSPEVIRKALSLPLTQSVMRGTGP